MLQSGVGYSELMWSGSSGSSGARVKRVEHLAPSTVDLRGCCIAADY